MMGGETGAADPEASLEQGMAAGMQELCPTQRRFSLQRGDYFLLLPHEDKKTPKSCCGGNGAWVKQPTTVLLSYHLFSTGI